MKTIYLLFIGLIIIGCTNTSNEFETSNQQFSQDLINLKESFHIPGLAVSVSKSGQEIFSNFKGFADIENHKKLDSTYVFPVASLTKMFTGVAIMKLVEDGKLRLESPMNEYMPNSKILSDSILVKHILSHTSQGKIGENFYYSSRFSALTRIIELASGMSYRDYIGETILSPLKMESTALLNDSIELRNSGLNIAKPYTYDGSIKPGFIDYGYSASAGIVSNLQDLQKFSKGLDQNLIIKKESKKKMFTSFNEDSPYGYGIFSQELLGTQVIWAYGQYDCYSSLFLKIPKKELTLILLANNNLMSDPARLIYGDLSSSLFALSFLKNYVVEPEGSFYTDLKQKEALANALSDSFLARYDDSKFHSSVDSILSLAQKDSTLIRNANINLLHNLSFLKDVAYYKKMGVFNTFDIFIETIGRDLHLKDPENPYVNIYLGAFYARMGQKENAQYHLEKVVNAKNFSRNWYTIEAENILKSWE